VQPFQEWVTKDCPQKHDPKYAFGKCAPLMPDLFDAAAQSAARPQEGIALGTVKMSLKRSRRHRAPPAATGSGWAGNSCSLLMFFK
jgi:hypothetical protein